MLTNPMLISHRKPQAPSGTAQLAAILEAAGSPPPGPLSKTEDAILGALWPLIAAASSLPAPSPRAHTGEQTALAALGNLLLNHHDNEAGLGVQQANVMVQLANRILFGPSATLDHPILDQATLGMAAIAAVTEPSQLKTRSSLVRWFVFQAVPAFGLEYLLPAPLVRALCASDGTAPPPAATWLWNATPALQKRFPGGWPSRAAAINWLLGPERHALDFLRPMLVEPIPPLQGTARNQTPISARSLAPGEMIDFTLHGNSDEYCLQTTWYGLEPLRRWGAPPSAMLSFCPTVAADTRLSLVASFMPSANFHQFGDSFLTIAVAGRTVLRDRWTELSPHRVVLDIGAAPPPGTVLPVAFQLWPPYYPSRHNSTDGRALGVPVSLLRLIAW